MAREPRSRNQRRMICESKSKSKREQEGVEVKLGEAIRGKARRGKGKREAERT